MSRQTFVLGGHEAARGRALKAVEVAPNGLVVEIREPTRSLEQNALLWPLLEEVSKKVNWYGQKLSSDDWKNMFTASLKKQRSVVGIDGGVVVLGQSTRVMSKADFSELIEFIYAFGAEHGVRFIDGCEA